MVRTDELEDQFLNISQVNSLLLLRFEPFSNLRHLNLPSIVQLKSILNLNIVFNVIIILDINFHHYSIFLFVALSTFNFHTQCNQSVFYDFATIHRKVLHDSLKNGLFVHPRMLKLIGYAS